MNNPEKQKELKDKFLKDCTDTHGKITMTVDDIFIWMNTNLLEKEEEELYIWDGINGVLEEVDDIEDAIEFIRENFCETNSIHPDIESVFIVKRVASVRIQETDETTEVDGEFIPVCKIIID